MRRAALIAMFATLALSTIGRAQELDKAKLDPFFDRPAAKKKAMGSLTRRSAGQ